MSDRSTQYEQDALSILINDGTGRLSHAPRSPILTPSDRAGAAAAGDTDGDGWPDVIALSL